MPAELDTRHIGRRVAEIAVIVAIVIAAVVALPGLGELRTHFADAQPGWIAGALVLELASCLSFVVAFRGTYCRRMSWRFSYQIAMAEQAANVLLPTGGAGGLALGAWALQRGGMSTCHIARRTVAFFLITSSVNFGVAVLTGPLLVLCDLPGDVSPALALVPAGLALATIAGVALLPRILPAGGPRPEGRVRRVLWTASGALSEGIADAFTLLRSGRPAIVLGAVGYMAFDAAALAAAFHAFGAAPPFGTFLLAYVLGQLGGLVPLPGGVGGTDGGLVAALALYGTPLATATAARIEPPPGIGPSAVG
jgi:uncharacterized membrane protein YbhN (UPF0104 family)